MRIGFFWYFMTVRNKDMFFYLRQLEKKDNIVLIIRMNVFKDIKEKIYKRKTNKL